MPPNLCRAWASLRRIVFISLIGALPVKPSLAQPPSPRQKVGIALAGGGALGIAHIGVLQWLEEHHIPVDAITGTSMGGIVGGCYASGMSAAEIKSVFLTVPWEEALATEAAFREQPFRRKEDLRALPTRLNIGLRKGFSLPDGLIPGQTVDMLLSRVALPYSDMKSFNDLPTPFRCMAVDLNTASAVTLGEGSLATALRATMAVPGLFTPLERNGKKLVDGGLLHNLPTEALKELGPDLIIAVTLGNPVDSATDTKSFASILGQALVVSTFGNERRSLELADIVIRPDLRNLTAIDFAATTSFVDRGYRAAEARGAILKRLALSDTEWAAYQAARAAKRRSAPASVEFVDVKGAASRENRRLQSRLKRFEGRPLDYDRLESDLRSISAEGRYESILYQESRRDGLTGLQVIPERRRYGPPFLKLGVFVNGADTDNIRFNVASRLIALDAGSPGAEVRADLRLGSDRDASIEYYRPIGSSRLFIAPSLFYTDDAQSIFTRGFPTAVYGTRTAGAALDIGYTTGRFSELRAGYQFNHVRGTIRAGSQILPSLTGDDNLLSIRWAYDGQDSESIPTRGVQVHTAFGWFLSNAGAPHEFPKAEATFSAFSPLRARESLFVNGGVGTTFGAQAGTVQRFAVGGPLRLGAYGPSEFRGNDYLYLSGGYLYRLANLPPFLGGKILIGSWGELGGAFSRFSSARYQTDLSAGVVAETLLGPVVVGGSFGESGRSSVYFAIGRLF